MDEIVCALRQSRDKLHNIPINGRIQRIAFARSGVIVHRQPKGGDVPHSL
jgi:hypothetical protein